MSKTISKSLTRGGRREGAGRKPGLGPWGEKTIPVRIPVSQKQNVLAFLHRQKAQPVTSLPAEALLPAIEPVRLNHILGQIMRHFNGIINGLQADPREVTPIWCTQTYRGKEYDDAKS